MGPAGGDRHGLLAQHSETVLAYLVRRAPSEQRALVLFREVMLRAWTRIDLLPVRSSHLQRIWLLAIAATVLASNAERSAQQRVATDPDVVTRQAVPPRGVFTGDARAVRDAIPRLRYLQRELVTMVHWDGLTLPDAATVLGLPQAVANREYNAARANLRAVLGGARI